ncbi:hypothetical protein KC332_g17697 [Hortaea werneckii]|uniref:Enoyl reductase (ER) domain-containing protein n=1 Tax=Hortaea werneckii EXF-2000 TaxID=1157616 RepID=A0A1Z5SQE9_HORWE|nr:hypothetical protein KC358_g18224 [Hortaea werneckii]OTA23059.1 hypothetical protein BTJ68_14539 [Hortaea werneckii EXF-2000]KAI6793429.1 hypothetical protein KC350_g17408 [Hortaea werneckii]KAI6918528.1 hypothetical protein KC341_g17840 [Hortaea werneckii]KAI6935907.1 hypothetical protein KC348_g6150 [Hortaea werneckii]
MSIRTEAYVARSDSLKLEEVEYLEPEGHELLVDIVAASLCHSDVKAAQGSFHMKPPMMLGHEAAGYVRAVGKAVSYVKPGDAVVLAYAHCGQCRRCLSGRQPYCENMFGLNFGGGRGSHGGVVSSMSRIALVRESSCVKVECSREELQKFASLGCGVQTGAGAIINVTKPAAGSSIVIFGGGAVGLAALSAAKLTHPACLVLVDNSSAKLEMIPKEILEGVQVMNTTGKSPEVIAADLKALTPTGQGMDYAIDGVGNESVVLAAHLCLDKLGTMLIVGGSPTAKLSPKIEGHLVGGLTTRGTHQGDSVSRVMIPHLINLWRAGKFPFDKFLTAFKFEELEKALDETHTGRVIKPILVL